MRRAALATLSEPRTFPGAKKGMTSGRKAFGEIECANGGFPLRSHAFLRAPILAILVGVP